MYINRFSTTMSTGLAKKNLKILKTDYTGHSATCSVQLDMVHSVQGGVPVLSILSRRERSEPTVVWNCGERSEPTVVGSCGERSEPTVVRNRGERSEPVCSGGMASAASPL